MLQKFLLSSECRLQALAVLVRAFESCIVVCRDDRGGGALGVVTMRLPESPDTRAMAVSAVLLFFIPGDLSFKAGTAREKLL